MTFAVTKDPQSVLDYQIDYTTVMAASTPDDAIASSAWAMVGIESDLVIDSNSFTDDIATVWLSGGGKLGSIYRLTNHIVCASGREYDRTIKVTIQSK